MSFSALKQFYERLKATNGDVAEICAETDAGKFDFYFPAPEGENYAAATEMIYSTVGNMANIAASPYMVLKSQLDARRAETAGALTPEGVKKTVADSRIWKISDEGPRPEYAYSRTSEDEYDTYENKLVKALIDRALDFIGKPLEETRGGIKSMYDVKSSRKNLNKFDMVRMIDFRVFSENDEHCFSEYKKLFYLRARLRQLKNSAFYKMMSRLSPFPDATPQATNLFLHNPDYAACMKLWLYLGAAINSEEEDENQTRKAYSAFVFLYTAYALYSMGFELSGRVDAEGFFGEVTAGNEWFTVKLIRGADKMTAEVKSRSTSDSQTTEIGFLTSRNGCRDFAYTVSMFPAECSDDVIFAFPDNRSSLGDLKTLAHCLVMTVGVTGGVYDRLCVVCGSNAVEEEQGEKKCADCGARYTFIAPNVVWIKYFSSGEER